MKKKKAMRYYKAYVKCFAIAQHEHTHADIRKAYTRMGNHFAQKYMETLNKCYAL